MDSIQFVIGEEKTLLDVISAGEVEPLLAGAIDAGIEQAMVIDAGDAVIWSRSKEADSTSASVSATFSHSVRSEQTIYLEGEPVGCLRLIGGEQQLSHTVARLVGGALQGMIHANLKRMLTTEIHTRVVDLSHEELLAINRQLAASEQKYRDLAANLEVRVQERTAELKKAYARMIQQEKLASIGQLAAGMAHEINNPLGFLTSNLNTLQKYVERLESMGRYALQQDVDDAGRAAKWKELKLDLVTEDLPDLLDQSIGGARRIQKIVSALRSFSHIDDCASQTVDLSAEIDRTLQVMEKEIPSDAQIIKEFNEIPPVPGHAGHLCQVFFNIIRNACQACPEQLELLIRGEIRDGMIRLLFHDNGPGIAKNVQNRIFEPFFTTRDVGHGMGLGLSVAYETLAAMGGTIEVDSRPGNGAVFILQWPVGEG